MTRTGQCLNAMAEDSQYCLVHGGNSAQQSAEKARMYAFRASQWRNRINSLADAPQLKRLNEEIGVLRMLLEEKMNQCEDATSLMIASPVITDLIMRIKETILVCHKIDATTGRLLDKSVLAAFASSIVDVIGQEIGDHETLDRIAGRILLMVQNASNDSG